MLAEFVQLPKSFSEIEELERWLEGFDFEGEFDPKNALINVLYAQFEGEKYSEGSLDRPKSISLVVKPEKPYEVSVSFLVVGEKKEERNYSYHPIKIELNPSEFDNLDKIINNKIENEKENGFGYPLDLIGMIKIKSWEDDQNAYHVSIRNEYVIEKKDFTKNLYAVKIKITAKNFDTFPSNLYLLSYKYNDSNYAKTQSTLYRLIEHEESKTIETTRIPVFAEKRFEFKKFDFDFSYRSLSKCPIETLEAFASELRQKEENQLKVLRALSEKKMLNDEEHKERIENEFASDKRRLDLELQGIENGIRALKDDVKLFEAFKLVNSAFYARYEHSLEKKNKEWRSFQLTFILSQIPSVFKNEKTLVLLNFPTGMGKTEAFMGLALLKIVYERLTKSNHGTSVIIKYPRKLLSRQQLKRALDIITFANAVLLDGTKDVIQHPISLGTLYNGEDTPNRYVDAAKGYRQVTYEFQEWNDPSKRAIKIDKCPYCGSDLDVKVDKETLRIKYICEKRDCLFSKIGGDAFFERIPGEIPLYIGDDEVFRYVPSILITTIDKFSTFASSNPNFKSLLIDKRIKLDSRYGFYFTTKNFKEFSKAISGNETDWEGFHDKFKTPSLFIFDEVHLINGAYASKLSVLENSFMDLFSKGECGEQPHVVCSSATVNQIFNDDGFFSYQSDMAKMFLIKPEKVQLYPTFWDLFVELKPEARRTIIAIMPDNYSHYLAIEHVSRYYFRRYAEIPLEYKRYYLTFLYYFKAKARLERVRGSLWDRVIASKFTEFDKNDFKQMEFSTDISQPKMEKDQDRINKIIREASENPNRKMMVFATNTIANGLDFEAFNTIFIFGFPNKISEYVQARSRISRNINAGLCALFLSQKNFREASVFYDFYNLHENVSLAIEATTINREAEGVMESMIKKLFHLALQLLYDSPDEPFYTRKVVRNILKDSLKLEKIKEMVYAWFSFENPSRDMTRRIFDEKWKNYVENYNKWLSVTNSPTIYDPQNICLPQPSLLDISTPVSIGLTDENATVARDMEGIAAAPLYDQEPNESGDDEFIDTSFVEKRSSQSGNLKRAKDSGKSRQFYQILTAFIPGQTYNYSPVIKARSGRIVSPSLTVLTKSLYGFQSIDDSTTDRIKYWLKNKILQRIREHSEKDVRDFNLIGIMPPPDRRIKVRLEIFPTTFTIRKGEEYIIGWDTKFVKSSLAEAKRTNERISMSQAQIVFCNSNSRDQEGIHQFRVNGMEKTKLEFPEEENWANQRIIIGNHSYPLTAEYAYRSDFDNIMSEYDKHPSSWKFKPILSSALTVFMPITFSDVFYPRPEIGALFNYVLRKNGIDNDKLDQTDKDVIKLIKSNLDEKPNTDDSKLQVSEEVIKRSIPSHAKEVIKALQELGSEDLKEEYKLWRMEEDSSTLRKEAKNFSYLTDFGLSSVTYLEPLECVNACIGWITGKTVPFQKGQTEEDLDEGGAMLRPIPMRKDNASIEYDPMQHDWNVIYTTIKSEGILFRFARKFSFEAKHAFAHLLLKVLPKLSGIEEGQLFEQIFDKADAIIIYSNEPGEFRTYGLKHVLENSLRDLLELTRDYINCPFEQSAAGCFYCLHQPVTCSFFNTRLDKTELRTLYEKGGKQ